MANLHCLDISDPRLRMHVSEADPKESSTKWAVSVLHNSLYGHENRAISGPSLGIPLRILALRLNGQTLCLANPKILAAGELRHYFGVRNIHMPQISLRACLPQTLEISGISPDGRSHTLEVPEEAIFDVIQAFSLFDGIDPLSFLTPFHKLWLKNRATSARPLFENISHALMRAHDAPQATSALRAQDISHVALCDDNGQEIAQLSSTSPSFPVDKVDQSLLFLLVRFSHLEHCFFAQPSLVSLAISTAMHCGGSAVHLSSESYPNRAIAELRLGGFIVPSPLSQNNTNPALIEQTALGSIVIDHRNLPDQSYNSLNFKEMSKHLHDNGALFYLVGQPCEAVERALQQSFMQVYRFAHPELDCCIYGARKREITPGVQKARSLYLANRLATPVEYLPAWTSGVFLQKDGNEIAL